MQEGASGAKGKTTRPGMGRTTVVTAIIVLVPVLLFVWPTPWRMVPFDGIDKPLRVNRLTGRIQVYDREERRWRRPETRDQVGAWQNATIHWE